MTEQEIRKQIKELENRILNNDMKCNDFFVSNSMPDMEIEELENQNGKLKSEIDSLWNKLDIKKGRV